uniref:4a-hydroxytetrahydrobiopterin dehydratase n=1 Tax=Thaumasiovibrio occultus TaxID=1891184 RepID=UPI000B35029B|nr:4a-hydroxytetrahydrobiopterin dehydratase [Thaumasiovibrio occultus]
MLESMQCKACHKGAEALLPDEYHIYLPELEGWHISQEDGVDLLQKTYSFSNFKKAWRFSDAVCGLAEEEGHHPEVVLSWGKVVVKWWTHSVNGLHLNDFICAKKTDVAFAEH